MILIIAVCLVLVNLVAFGMFGYDKSMAQTHQWRISERALFGVALLGGSLGALLGMRYFRHKTKHWYFQFGIPSILVAQLVLAAVLLLHLYK